MRTKKSQVTIFIILGLIILAGVAILIYFKTIGITPKAALSIIQEEAPTEFKPVQSFITQCLKDVSEEAIRKVGMNGGYIDPEDQTYGGPSFKIDTSDPTNGEVLKISETQKIPYWYHMPASNSCGLDECFLAYGIPPLNETEIQIENYVNLNIEPCFNNFEIFKTQNLIVTPLGTPNTTVSIGKDDIILQLQYSVNIQKGTSQQKLNYYNVKQPIDYIGFYLAALKITSAEANNRFLEKAILYIMSFYQSTDLSLLPPIYSEDYKFNSIEWSKTMVEMNIKNLLSTYIPLFKIANTKNAENYNSEKIIENNIYQKLYLENDYQPFKNYQIKFYYTNWPIYLHISPSQGDSIKPHKSTIDYGLDIMPTETKNTYSFKYDISIPVLVEIRNNESFDGKGYSLFFALEGNIRDNYDILTYLTYSPPALPGPLIQIEGMEEFIDKGAKMKTNTGEEITVPSPKQLPSDHIFCDDKQKIGPEMTFIVKDKSTQQPLKEVRIFYVCGPFFSCRVGETDEKGFLKGKLPLCNGGAIRFNHEDYFSWYELYDSKPNMPADTKNIELFKQFKKNYKIKILYVEDLKTVPNEKLKDKTFVKTFRDKYNYDEIGTESTVILTLNRIKENAYSADHTRMAKFDLIASKMEGEMDLVPAQTGYKINIIYINNTLHHMEGSTECFDTCWDPTEILCEDECAPYPPKDLDKGTLQGSAVIDEDNILWEVDYDDLTNPEKDTVIFYLLKMKLPKYTKDMGDLGKLQEYSKKYRWFIQPEFVSSKDETTVT